VNPDGTVIEPAKIRKVFNVGTPLVIPSLIRVGSCSTDLCTMASSLLSAITLAIVIINSSSRSRVPGKGRTLGLRFRARPSRPLSASTPILRCRYSVHFIRIHRKFCGAAIRYPKWITRCLRQWRAVEREAGRPPTNLVVRDSVVWSRMRFGRREFSSSPIGHRKRLIESLPRSFWPIILHVEALH